MKRQANTHLSPSGDLVLPQYEKTLREQEDLTPASVHNYLSDIRHFKAWYEARENEQATGTQDGCGFDPQAITTSMLIRYRTYLQTVQRQKPASVNRSLISLKRSFGWAMRHHLITYNPSAPMRLFGQEDIAPRHLDDYLATLPSNMIFLSPSGKTKDAQAERAPGYIVKKYACVAKLPDVSPHDLQQAVETIAWI